jgi:hypothetical protein
MRERGHQHTTARTASRSSRREQRAVGRRRGPEQADLETRASMYRSTFEELHATYVWLKLRLAPPTTRDELRDVVKCIMNSRPPMTNLRGPRLPTSELQLQPEFVSAQRKRQQHGAPEWAELIAFANGTGDVRCPCGSGTKSKQCCFGGRGEQHIAAMTTEEVGQINVRRN